MSLLLWKCLLWFAGRYSLEPETTSENIFNIEKPSDRDRQIADKDRQIQSILSSRSYKITAQLRKIGRCLGTCNYEKKLFTDVI